MGDTSLVKGIWLITILFSAFVILKAVEAKESIDNVVSSQRQINNSLSIHINTFQALEASIEGWDNGLRNISAAKDLLSMYDLLNLDQFGLDSPLDKFTLVSATSYEEYGTDIGLLNVCVDTGNGTFAVSSSSYGQLIIGLEGMANSKGFSFDYVNVLGGDSAAKAEIGNLCVLLKAEGASV